MTPPNLDDNHCADHFCPSKLVGWAPPLTMQYFLCSGESKNSITSNCFDGKLFDVEIQKCIPAIRVTFVLSCHVLLMAVLLV